jgi:hypothetical protein
MYKLRAVAAVGGAGSDTKETVRGNIKAVHVVFDASSNANTNVTLTDEWASPGASQTIFADTTFNTSAWYYPRAYAQTTAGVDLTFDGTRKVPAQFTICGQLKLAITDQTATKGVTVYVLVEEY